MDLPRNRLLMDIQDGFHKISTKKMVYHVSYRISKLKHQRMNRTSLADLRHQAQLDQRSYTIEKDIRLDVNTDWESKFSTWNFTMKISTLLIF